MSEVNAPAERSRAVTSLNPAELRRWRKEVRMLSQVQLADAAGLSRGEISHLETAKRKPLATTLSRLCVALQCQPEDLLGPGKEESLNGDTDQSTTPADGG